MDTCSAIRVRSFSVDQGGSMPAIDLGDRTYVMLCVENVTPFKIDRHLKKSDASSALRKIISDYITSSDLKIGSI